MARTKKTTKAEPAAESLSFEGALDQLEQTVAQLEEGEMPLEAALELFESGVKLSRQCGATLEAAEKRIEILVADRADALSTEPFEDDGLGDESADEFEDDFDEDG